MKITCIDKDVKAVLDGGYYRIPRFQRPYSWDKDNVEEFWNDAVVDSESIYFIGSIVVFKSADVYGIVDGQQRLTTITMILCSIRNEMRGQGFSELASGIHNQVERKDINNKPQFILQTETSYPYLQEHIQKEGQPDAGREISQEEENLAVSFNMIQSYIRGSIKAIELDTALTAEQRKEKIKETLVGIRDKILKLSLIFIVLDNEDDAYIIFETLNTRGKDLAVSDLVKNHLTRLLKPTNANVDRVKDKWNNMVDMLEQSQADLSMNNFLHHFWLSRYDYVTEKKLFKKLKKTIKRSNAKQFLDTLVTESRTYREILEPSYRKWKKQERDIRDSLEGLNLFRVKQQLPMVISVIREYLDESLRHKETIEILQAIERFHFLFTAVTSQRSSGGISFMYAFHARELLHKQSRNDKLQVLKDLRAKLSTRKPSYEEFEALFSQILFSKQFTKQKKLVQYILAKIDAYHSDGLPVDYTQMTIEHIVPQSGSILPQIAAQLGNLVLTNAKLNERLNNKSFTEKKKILTNSRVWIDPVFKSAKEWDASSIENRTKALAKLAYEKIWAL
jgi:hypothetical protein